MLKGAAIGQN